MGKIETEIQMREKFILNSVALLQQGIIHTLNVFPSLHVDDVPIVHTRQVFYVRFTAFMPVFPLVSFLSSVFAVLNFQFSLDPWYVYVRYWLFVIEVRALSMQNK